MVAVVSFFWKKKYKKISDLEVIDFYNGSQAF